jgi:glycosyltransferase involved in cell wall biosynthesis
MPIVLSIVCAARNVAHSIQSLFDSYKQEGIAQTELIVIDGDSSDNTREIILNNSDIIGKAISEPDSGIYDAWNKALKLCSGRYVAFIGADDRIAPGALSGLVHYIELMSSDPHVISGYSIQTRQGVPVALLGGECRPQMLWRRMMVSHILCAHKLDWLLNAGGFDISYKSSGDYELLLRNRKHLVAENVNFILAFVEDGGISTVSYLAFIEDYRARLNNGIHWSVCILLLLRAVVGRTIRKWFL